MVAHTTGSLISKTVFTLETTSMHKGSIVWFSRLIDQTELVVYGFTMIKATNISDCSLSAIRVRIYSICNRTFENRTVITKQ